MPSSEITGAAEQFVDLALKYRWNEVKTLLPADEMEVLIGTVSTAGFNLKKMQQGESTGCFRDEYGYITSKHPINDLCPFKVVDEDGHEDAFATGWLDCALRRVVYGSSRQNKSRETLIEVIAEEIKRSIPFEPIQLTQEHDFLREPRPRPAESSQFEWIFEYFVEHTRDKDSLYLNSGVGIHYLSLGVGRQKRCGWMKRVQATRVQDVVWCRGCGLWVPFTNEVETYSDLRLW